MYHAPLSVGSPIRWLRRAYPLAPPEKSRIGGRKSRKKKFPELGLPGVEILNGACTSILHLSRGSQSPYSEKSKKSRYLIKILISPIHSLFPRFGANRWEPMVVGCLQHEALCNAAEGLGELETTTSWQGSTIGLDGRTCTYG